MTHPPGFVVKKAYYFSEWDKCPYPCNRIQLYEKFKVWNGSFAPSKNKSDSQAAKGYWHEHQQDMERIHKLLQK